jgi:CubicO group peptidase (beta-lactamase class C family)
MLDRRRFGAAAAAAATFRLRRAWAAVDYSLLNKATALGSRKGGSGTIRFDGTPIAAWGDQYQRYELKSATKTIGALLLGVAIKRKGMSLDDLARHYLPTLGIPPAENDAKGWPKLITIQDLATHVAGFDKKGGFEKLLFRPQSKWSYSDCGANWLADVLTVRFGADLRSVLRTRLLQSIGADGGVSWRLNRYRPQRINGIVRREFGSGISASVDALARIGQLLLDGGRGLIDQSFIEAMSTPKPTVAAVSQTGTTVHAGANHHYGLLCWNNGDGAMADVPRDAYWSWGLGDSFMLVVPSKRLVVARLGPTWEPDWGDLAAIQPFFASVCAAVD